MAKSKNYDVAQVLRSLSAKRAVVVNEATRKVDIICGPGYEPLGIKSRGKLDYLTNYCGWTKEYIY